MMKQSFVLCLVLFSMLSVEASDDKTTTEEPGYNIPGGRFRITDEKELSDLTKKVTTHLKGLSATKDGPNLEFIRVKSAEYQVVAGYIYHLVAEINENKKPTECKISLWEKPWLDFIKLDVECGEEKRKYQYKPKEDPDDIPSSTPKA